MADETLRLIIENIVKEKQALAKMQAQIESTEKAVDHFGDTLGESEQDYQKLMRTLERGKGPAVAKAALERLDRLLKTGKINAQQYGVAAEALAVRTGRITPQAKAAADRLQQLEERFAKGKISGQKYAEGIDDIGKELGELEGKQEKTGSILESSWAKVAVGIGIATAALAAMKKVYDFAKEGAEIARLRDSFEKLGNSERDLEILRKASLNSISDQNLMLATNKAQLLGVSDNTEDLAGLLEVAAVRGRAMGLSTSEAFSDIITGVGRLSPMILDNLGIVTGGQKVFDDYARTLGITADKLTDVQKRQALVNLIITQGAELGPLMADQATRLEQLEVGFENFFNTVKEGAANVMVGTIDNIDIVLNSQAHMADAFIEHQNNMTDAVINGEVTYAEYIAEVNRAAEAAGAFGAETRHLVNQALDPMNESLVIAIQQGKQLEASDVALAQARGSVMQVTRDAADALAEYNSEEQVQIRMQQELTTMQAALTGTIGKQREEFVSSQTEMSDRRQEIIDQLAELRDAHGEVTTAGISQRLNDDELIVREGALAEATTKHAEAQATLAEAMTSGAATEEIAKLKIEAAKAGIALGQASDAMPRFVSGTTANIEAIGELTGELDEVNTALAENTAAHEEAVARQIFAWAMQRAAVGGTTAEEMKLLQQVGTQLGIFDEATTIAIDGVNEAFDRLDEGGSLDDVAEDLQQIVDTASAIPTDVAMNVSITTSGALPEGFVPRGTQKGGAAAGQHGLDEIVGPGFQHSRNGGKLFSAETNERVRIESVGEQGVGSISSARLDSRAGATIQITNHFTVNSQQDAEDAARLIAQIIEENQT